MSRLNVCVGTAALAGALAGALTGIPAGALAGAVTGAANAQAEGGVNLQVLEGVPPDQLQSIMEATAVSLGVECEHCHVPAAFELDEKPAKTTAREMIRMVGSLSSTWFELLESPSCWTCHRGAVSPEAVPPPLLDSTLNEAPFGPFSESTLPAGEVYENVRVHGTIPANELRGVMASYTRALGVGCDHCHIAGDWASDENVLKELTRFMVEAERGMVADHLSGNDAVSCWTCHRGEATPQSNLPPALMPDPGN